MTNAKTQFTDSQKLRQTAERKKKRTEKEYCDNGKVRDRTDRKRKRADQNYHDSEKVRETTERKRKRAKTEYRLEVKALTTALALSKELPALLTAVQKLTRDGREATISTKDRREPTGDDQTESPPPKWAAKPEVHLTVLPDEDLKCNGTNKVLLPMKKV